MSGRKSALSFSQEKIVFGIFVLTFVAFSIGLNGFFTAGNIGALLQNVSIIGILSLGMALVVIGRGVDLAIVAIMAISMAWVISLINLRYPIALAIGAGLLFAVIVGIVQGILIAYLEIPAIFATLAMTSVVYGFGRIALVEQDIIHMADVPAGLSFLGRGYVLGVPTPVIVFALFALSIFAIFKFTKVGVFIRCIGDNTLRARIGGIPVRVVIVIQYVISAIIGLSAGVLMATLVGSMNTRIIVSTLVYDVVLVVVLGGIGLSGGKGGVRNVIVGTLLIGTLLNGMTIMNVPFNIQNIIKGVVLLISIGADSFLNPRDEQTSQQGDI